MSTDFKNFHKVMSQLFPDPREMREVMEQIVESALNKRGLCSAHILRSKYAGVMRPKNKELFEGEWILVATPFGVRSDSTPLASWGPNLTVAEVEALETGVVKYYLCLLPALGTRRTRPLGPTQCNIETLAQCKFFDHYPTALEAFENA